MIWVINSLDLYSFIATSCFRRNFKFRIVQEKFIVFSAFVDPEQPVTVSDVHAWFVSDLE
tara:strand:+ start:244 stop:423 length:180 start_codon:yes stop_codon:yes gene_type:complete